MKKTLYILIALIVSVLFFVLINRTDENAANKTDIEKVRQEFRSQLSKVLIECDSLKAAIQQVKADTDTLKADTDTIKAGQRAIFETMKENENKSLFDWLWE